MLLAISTVSFSHGLTSNVFRCTTSLEDVKIGTILGLVQGVLILLGLLLGGWIIGFAGSMGFSIGVATLIISGIRMIMESRKGDPDDSAFKLDDTIMIAVMALAASINGFIVSIGLPAFDIHVLAFAGASAVFAGLLAFLGVKLGKKYGKYSWGKYAKLGGAITILAIAVFHLVVYMID